MGDTVTLTMSDVLAWRKATYLQLASIASGTKWCSIWMSMAGECKVKDGDKVAYLGHDWDEALEVYNKLVGA